MVRLDDVLHPESSSLDAGVFAAPDEPGTLSGPGMNTPEVLPPLSPLLLLLDAPASLGTQAWNLP